MTETTNNADESANENAGGAAQAAEPGAPDQGTASSPDADPASGSSGAPAAQLASLQARRDALFALENPTDAETYELKVLDGRLADELEMADAERAVFASSTDDELKADREELLLLDPDEQTDANRTEIKQIEDELTRRVQGRDAQRELLELAIAALPELTDEELAERFDTIAGENDPANAELVRAIAKESRGRQQQLQVLTPNAAGRICIELEAIARALGADVIPWDHVPDVGQYNDVDRVVHRLIDIKIALEELDLAGA